MRDDFGMTEEQKRLDKLLGRIASLRLQFDQIRLTGGRNVIVDGEPRRGFRIDIISDGGGGAGEGQPPVDRGCTDPTAINFNPSATVDNGTCIYEGCTDPDAINFDPRAGIDDGSCIFENEGACCLPDGSCTFGTEADCTGIYQGDGTECGAFVCPEKQGCTDPTADNYDPEAVIDDGSCTYTCPGITLLCDSISAAKSKCGFSSDGKRWLSQLFTTHATGGHSGFSPSYECRNSGVFAHIVPNSFSVSFDVFSIKTLHYVDLDCSALITECHQGGTVSQSNSASSACGDEECTVSGSIIDTGSCTFPPSTPPAPVLQISCDAFTCGVEFPSDSIGPCGFLNVWNNSSPPTTLSYDDEYTTDMLKGHTEASLPGYSGVYTGGACASSRYLSSDEETYSIQRSKPQFTYSALGVDFNICYNERFTPTGGGSPVDTPQCILAPAGSTEAFGPELFEPAENGTTLIVDVNCVF